MRRWTRCLVLGAVALSPALLPSDGQSHAFLVRSAPAGRATLSRSPARVVLTFNERLEPAYSRVSVLAEDGTRVDQGDGAVDGSDPKLLGVSLPALGPGRYIVRFRVLSVDGHIVEAEFPFTVRPTTAQP